MYQYWVYGLLIHSELALPELDLAETHSSQPADVQIFLQDVQPPFPQQPLIDGYYQMSGDSVDSHAFYFSWELSGAFLVEGGRRITIQVNPDIDASAARLPLFGVVMATLLSQRGFLVMHASAIEIAGRAVAFVGHKGQGKSTMSATLNGLGYPLVADDVVAICFDAMGRPMLAPGIPMFKLWPDAVTAAFQEDPESLRKVHPSLEKRSRLVKDNCSQHPVPLQTLYVLGTGDEIEIAQLSPQVALRELLTHSYMARFGNCLLQGPAGRQHFRACTQLLQSSEVCSLNRPRDLDLLPEIARQVSQRLAVVQPLVAV